MGISIRILYMVLILALFAFLGWLLIGRAPTEPVTAGKPLTFWLIEISNGTNEARRSEAMNAVREIGPGAVPTLIKILNSRDSELKKRLLELRDRFHVPLSNNIDPILLRHRAWAGLRALGPQGVTATPALVQILKKGDNEEFQGDAAKALADIGPAAKAAVPDLLPAVTSTNEWISSSSIWALGEIHADAEQSVPVLLRELANPKSPNRENAALAIGKFGPEAQAYIPELQKVLANSSSSSNAVQQSLPDYLKTRIENTIKEINLGPK